MLLKKDTDRNLYAFISHNFKRIQHDRHRMNDKEFHNNIIMLSFLDNYKQSFYIGSLIVKKLILSIVITRRSKREVKARGESDRVLSAIKYRSRLNHFPFNFLHMRCFQAIDFKNLCCYFFLVFHQ